MIKILGIAAFYHDSSASLIIDGHIKYAIQEERFTRLKHDSSFPAQSIKYILDNFNLNLNDIDHIVFYEKPFIKFERLVETYLAFVPRGFNSFRKAMPLWSKEKLFQKKSIREELTKIDKNFKKKK